VATAPISSDGDGPERPAETGEDDSNIFMYASIREQAEKLEICCGAYGRARGPGTTLLILS